MADVEHVVENYFAAMRRGAEAEADLMSLFTEGAVYVEPFSGSADPAVGVDQIRERLRMGWENPLPDLELDVLSIESSGSTAISRWECRSSAFPAPIRGTDVYTFVGDRIDRLEVTIEEAE